MSMKKGVWIFLLMVWGGGAVFPQNVDFSEVHALPDSLAQLVSGGETPKQRLQAYLKLSRYYLHFQPDSALRYAKKAQKEANTLGDVLALAQSKNLLGETFMLQGVYSQAIKLLLEASEHFEKVQNLSGLAENYLTLGSAYQYAKQLEKAQEQFEAARIIFEKLPESKGLAQTYGALGHVYEKRSTYPEALKFQRKALSLYQSLDDAEGMATIYDNLGSIYEDLANFDSAYFYFSASAELNRLTNNQAALIISLNNVGDTFRKQGNYDKALEYTRQSLALARELSQKYQMRSAYRDLSKIYAGMEAYEQAYTYMDSTYEFTGEIFNQQIAEQIAQLQTLYETQQKEQEIALLESERKAEALLRYGFIGTLALILLVGYIIIQQQKLKIRQNKELLDKKQKVYEAQQALTQAELYNTQLKEKALQTELENKRLKELQLNNELEIKDKEMTTRALHIIQKNKMLKELKENIDEIKKNSNGSVKKKEINKLAKLIDYSFSFDKDWEDFQRSFEQVHSRFFEELKTRYPDLTPSELRLCALLRLNLNSKDIATILGISQDSLRIARYRLRKRFDLPKGSNLVNHIMHL